MRNSYKCLDWKLMLMGWWFAVPAIIKRSRDRMNIKESWSSEETFETDTPTDQWVVIYQRFCHGEASDARTGRSCHGSCVKIRLLGCFQLESVTYLSKKNYFWAIRSLVSFSPRIIHDDPRDNIWVPRVKGYSFQVMTLPVKNIAL